MDSWHESHKRCLCAEDAGPRLDEQTSQARIELAERDQQDVFPAAEHQPFYAPGLFVDQEQYHGFDWHHEFCRHDCHKPSPLLLPGWGSVKAICDWRSRTTTVQVNSRLYLSICQARFLILAGSHSAPPLGIPFSPNLRALEGAGCRR